MPDTIPTRRAQELISSALVWDAHAGFAFEAAEHLAELTRWREAGISFVSVNACYDVQPWTSAIEALSQYRHWLRAHQEFVQVETTALNTERAALSLASDRLVTSVQLIAALGGGWEPPKSDESP